MNEIESSVISSELAEKNIVTNNNGEAKAIAGACPGACHCDGSAVYIDMICVGSDELNFAKKSAKLLFRYV